MGQHWGKIHTGLHEVHPVKEPVEHAGQQIPKMPAESKAHEENLQSDGEMRKSLVGTAQHSQHDLAQRPSKARKIQRSASEGLYLSDSEDEGHKEEAITSNGSSPSEHQLSIMRKVSRKWRRLAGLHFHPEMCATQGEEFGVHWTKGICPRNEGRIKMVGVPN